MERASAPERCSPPRGIVLAAWALAAAVNLSAGLVIASWPERRSDLESMQRWGHAWLVTGSNVYETDEGLPDYPPHALVALSPLGAIPDRLAVPVWGSINLGLALLAPCLAVRAVCPGATLSAAALPILMFLCWGGFRTLLQFSLLSLTAGLLSMIVADRKPVWSGVCLGLALMKPQMAAPFLLWALFTRRWRVAGVALGVVAMGTAVFCLRAGANPLDVTLRYADILRVYHTGEPILVGLAQLRPLVALVASHPALVDALTAAVAVALLAAVCVLGLTEEKRRAPTRYAAPALAGVWSLLTFYHLTYGFVLLLPAGLLLWSVGDPRTRSVRRRVFWGLQLAMMLDVPGIWGRARHLIAPNRMLDAMLPHFDRGFMLALFGCLAVLACAQLRAAKRFLR